MTQQQQDALLGQIQSKEHMLRLREKQEHDMWDTDRPSALTRNDPGLLAKTDPPTSAAPGSQ
jgi:hypothetical protein